MEKLYLSQRNLTALLEKLDAVRRGEASACTIIKNDTAHPVYPQTLRRISVIAVEEQNRYMPGVSPRLQLSRPMLMSLLNLIEEQSGGAILIGEVEVFAIPDGQYYADRDDAKTVPVGDLASAFIRSRGRQP